MSCRAWRSRLALFSGGDLFGEDARAVRRHLDVCSACRREADGLAAVRKSLEETVAAEFSSDELSEVRRGAWRRIESFRAARPSWPPALLKAGAFGAAALFAAALLTERPRTSMSPAAAPAIAVRPTSPATSDGLSLRSGPDAGPPRSAAAFSRESGRRAAASPRLRRRGAAPVRLEFATSDPDVRIVWLDSSDGPASPPVAPENTEPEMESETSHPTEESR